MKPVPATDLSLLKHRWPSEFVARGQVGAFTGGLVSPGPLANADCVGEGPGGAIRIGNKVGYPVDSLIRWIESRVKELKPDLSQARVARRNGKGRGERKRRAGKEARVKL